MQSVLVVFSIPDDRWPPQAGRQSFIIDNRVTNRGFSKSGRVSCRAQTVCQSSDKGVTK